ncbi:MAG: hypothetical protein EB120_06815 [Proteobacteria bacterium]|nr:hypothetical protein [Pseudomonadota bacterium]
MLEDGNEVNNTLNRNLAILAMFTTVPGTFHSLANFRPLKIFRQEFISGAEQRCLTTVFLKETVGVFFLLTTKLLKIVL